MPKIYIPRRTKELIGGVLILLIGIVIVVQFLNFMAKLQKDNKTEKPEEETTKYAEQSYDIYQGESIPEQYQEVLADTIKSFFDSCVAHHPEDAYDLLSEDVKEKYYPALQIFKTQYYDEKFQGNKEYTFETWKIDNLEFVYKVKIFPDILSTGKGDIAKDFIEDYVSIVEDEKSGLLKLNINNYISKKELNKKGENNKVSITATSVDTYVDYEEYTFEIKNKTDKRIFLDTLTQPDTIYLENEKRYKFQALKYENLQEDMILEPYETEKIKIKFNDPFKTDIYNICFTDVVEEEVYNARPYQTKDTIKIEIQ